LKGKPAEKGLRAMTNQEAIETCAKAMIRRLGHSDVHWRGTPKADLAADIIAALEALKLFVPTR
jgi:hypothetical protein